MELLAYHSDDGSLAALEGSLQWVRLEGGSFRKKTVKLIEVSLPPKVWSRVWGQFRFLSYMSSSKRAVSPCEIQQPVIGGPSIQVVDVKPNRDWPD